MNILWIEDFGGALNSGTATLNLMFHDLISFDHWDEDELSLLNRPGDLENYFRSHSASHCVYLCRHYFDYIEFKSNHDMIKTIDAVIIDIRLNNKVDFSLPIPDDFHDKEKFHNNAGFYIYNDLVHQGIASESVCFMTGEKISFTEFKTKCNDVYIPTVAGFEKKQADYDKLRTWIKSQQSDYTQLRRGIIDGCEAIKSLSEDKLCFNDFINSKETEKQVSLEDLHDYLDVLSNFLPLRKPQNTTALYKLFIRILAHEWEAAQPTSQNKSKEQFAFAWIMKTTRNWLAHSKLFEHLNSQDVAFLFMVNMRAMFNLGDRLLPYEQQLLSVFTDAVSKPEMKAFIGTDHKSRKMPLVENYADLLGKSGSNWEANSFHNLLINLQNNKERSRNISSDFFIRSLYQVFWFITSNGYVFIPQDKEKIKAYFNLNYQFKYFDYQKPEYLFELARHIYKRSFTE